MSASATAIPTTNEPLKQAIQSAVDSIAPSWPLDRLIAVNPYWGHVQHSFDATAKTLAKLAGSPLAMPTDYYRQAWTRGEIGVNDLSQAMSENNIGMTSEQLIGVLDNGSARPQPLALLSDQIDLHRDLQTHPSWFDTITHQVSQFCAAYFDRQQADWHPGQGQSLYSSWRRSISKDRSIHLLMGESRIQQRAGLLALEPVDQILSSLVEFDVPEAEWSRYLQALILRIGGWGSWCAYLRWQKQLDGQDDDTLVDLLAIRLSWETLLDDGARSPDSVWSAWMSDWLDHDWSTGDFALETQLIWQRAQEISYQRGLVAALGSVDSEPMKATPSVQAAFCIDVRSEVFRRHLEAQSNDIQTLGFAGFFGLPISYAPLGTQASRPQLPGLLAPQLHITDSSGDSDADTEIANRRLGKLKGMSGWQTFQSVPLSTFSLVETLGIGYLAKLVKRSLPSSAPRVSEETLGLNSHQVGMLRPTLDAAAVGGVDGQADIAAKVLSAMGLGPTFARLVLLIGHGSQTINNPQQAGLDCGACCGQTGEVNARALAGLLNCPKVREQLRSHGIELPESTQFIAGLHNTTTDDIRLYDLGQLPNSHQQDLKRLEQQLAAASASARAERAPALGLGKLHDRPEVLHRELTRRADDWSQTRPEWGLANNAAFIVAPRSRTRGIDLKGRSFLHDYDHRQDEDGSLLELIMTAPMIVTHWINMQYFASTVDNKRYGSGSKTLHNVVGGNIGLFEGNGGDLRIGLPWQSLNDGTQWRHTPLRLTVVIEASGSAIEAVIERHEIVRQLISNRWIHLMRLEDERIEVYQDGKWQVWKD